MAKNNPVKSCVIKHKPNKDPKFHHAEILTGAGRSTRAWFRIFNKGCVERRVDIEGTTKCYYIVLRIKHNNNQC